MEATSDDAQEISYEVKMLACLLVNIMEEATIETGAPWDRVGFNAVIESHLLHARNLIDFFVPTAPRKDDVLVSHFLETPLRTSGVEIDRLKVIRLEIHKRLAHLTQHRRTNYDGWSSLIITGDLMTLVEQFLQTFRIEQRQLVGWFVECAKVNDNFQSDFSEEYLEAVKATS